ncbi:MAG: tRNA-intron lyase [Methanotrichaceae archaeon]|nr:tRNA-intron lyase [Methanotrichaceae archaeon]
MAGEITGRLQDGKVRVGQAAISELYEQGYFGKPSGNVLELSLVEAAYLLDRSKIKVDSEGIELDFKSFFQLSSALEKGLEIKYVVYKDLRERGYYVQPGKPDFRVYPRGGHPGKTAAEFYVFVLSERMSLPLQELVEATMLAGQMRKKLMIAIVDEESDITFYEARKKIISGRTDHNVQGGMATLLDDRVMLWDPDASRGLHKHGFFGKLVDERLQLSLVESAYLLDRGLIKLVDRSGASVDIRRLMEQARCIENDFDTKYEVYRDLRNHKLVVKTGFKFGTHFRVYKNVESLEKIQHSEYLVHTVPKDHVFLPPVLSRAVRLAHSVKKQMIFAYSDGEVKYLEIKRLRP